jgi:hypothetical protein
MEEEQSDDQMFRVSEVKAGWLLERAGELTDEDPELITIKKYENLLSDKDHFIIQEVLQENFRISKVLLFTAGEV